MDAVVCRTLFSRLISIFVFDILEIRSGVCRFAVGVLQPAGYGSGLHREYLCFGDSYIMMN